MVIFSVIVEIKFFQINLIARYVKHIVVLTLGERFYRSNCSLAITFNAKNYAHQNSISCKVKGYRFKVRGNDS